MGVLLSLALASTLGMYFARRAVVTLRIGEPDTFWQGPLPMVLGVVGEVVYLLPFSLLAVWAIDPVSAGTIGKRIVGLRLMAADGSPSAPIARWRRWTMQTCALWGWTVALIVGRWEIAAAATVAGVVIAAGAILALITSGQTLHDRFSRTAVRSIRPR